MSKKKIGKYKPAYKSKKKIPVRYLKDLTKIERKKMEKEILTRPPSLRYWTGDKAYEARLKKTGKKLPKSKYLKKYIKKYGQENSGSLSKISKTTGIPLSILKQVYKRGIGAWTSGHRPGVRPSQWAKARVYSFVTGGKTTKSADKDLYEKIKHKIKK